MESQYKDVKQYYENNPTLIFEHFSPPNGIFSIYQRDCRNIQTPQKAMSDFTERKQRIETQIKDLLDQVKDNIEKDLFNGDKNEYNSKFRNVGHGQKLAVLEKAVADYAGSDQQFSAGLQKVVSKLGPLVSSYESLSMKDDVSKADDKNLNRMAKLVQNNVLNIKDKNLSVYEKLMRIALMIKDEKKKEKDEKDKKDKKDDDKDKKKDEKKDGDKF